MLNLTIRTGEVFDESSNRFSSSETFELQFEHSLVSLSKWESFFEIPFMTKKDKTSEQLLWYIQAMCLTPEIPPEVFLKLSSDNLDEINKYINSKQTATTFRDGEKRSNEIITSEIIYYWMVSFNIPFECQYWHINRLLTLIKVCSRKATPAKKMSKGQIAAQQRALNLQRRAQYGTNG